jgi:PPK2 family polyphosphate:nucleotide phosphotransferase
VKHNRFVVPFGGRVSLKDYDPTDTGKYKEKEEAVAKLQKDKERLAKYQDILYAQDTYALLIVLQAMDAAGKDSTISHVMSGVNPQGVEITSFKAPSPEELDHDYLWRCGRALPARGMIGIFNRSHYEEVLIVRVHPDILDREQLPPEARKKNIWKKRFVEINNFEHYLVRNGMHILKFFLHVSKEEQRRRFLARIDTPEKNWKFSLSDAKERECWDDYMKAYEDTLTHTSTDWAPWYVIPADNKWFTRMAVADIIISKLKSLKLHYPVVDKEQTENLSKAKEVLEREAQA